MPGIQSEISDAPDSQERAEWLIESVNVGSAVKSTRAPFVAASLEKWNVTEELLSE